jgi:hypothetical protein
MLLPRRLSTVTPLFLLAGCLSLCGCASSGKEAAGNTPKEAPLLRGAPRNFSGHWEKNFQLSDDFNNTFNLYAANIRRAYAPQGRGNNLNNSPAVGASSDAINGLARFSEELTRMPLLDIMQNDKEVRVDRQEDFPLRCAFAGRQFVRSDNSFGSDACGWESEQRLVFQMALGGGLTISYQFTLSADSNMLNVTTRVSSSSVAVPLVISNYYTRYSSPEQDYDCQLTLTRSNVCSRRKPPGQ